MSLQRTSGMPLNHGGVIVALLTVFLLMLLLILNLMLLLVLKAVLKMMILVQLQEKSEINVVSLLRKTIGLWYYYTMKQRYM